MNASTTKFDLQLAGEIQLPALLPLTADYHAFESVSSTADEREATARTLLAHPEFGAVWLVRADGLDAGYIAPDYAATASARACSYWSAPRRVLATSSRCISKSHETVRRRVNSTVKPVSSRATSTC